MQTDIVSSTNSEDRASSNRKWELRDLVVLSSATESAPEAKASVSPASDANDARSLAQTAVRSVPRPILDVLKLRGIEAPEQIANWFKPTLRSLRDPLSLKDMDKAVERLLLAREESIVLYGDYDLDGTSGLALALQALREFGFTRVHGYQPQRLTEGYGLHNEAIERLKRETDCTLLISIDLGITAMEEVETARALGIDVIVTDHHLPKRDADAVILPNACAVVNPNRGDCPSQMGHLCGTGVIFYLVPALRRALLEQGMLGGAESVLDPKELLDCFAIGTITDLVPLQFENRILVKHGLVKLAETKRPGLQELL
ncbi:MAG: DHH family phosphoesterase, partial [Bdellovibrionales bacterium]|nr:DHH family phosphoesterase [Bdellovibrionales bacterium]